MPCYDPVTPEEERAGYYASFVHNSHLAEICCTLCKELEELNALYKRNKPLPKAAANWWNEHKKRDAEKLAKEKAVKDENEARKQALAKLTPAERKLLKL